MSCRMLFDEQPDRGEEIQRLYLAAYQAGLATDLNRVDRHLDWYRRWNRGHIALGHLMNRTGVKMRPKVTIQRKVDMTTDGTTLMVDTIHGTVRHIRIFQGYGDLPDVHSFDAVDIESGAVTPAEAASIVRTRVLAGIPWTHLYGTDATLAETGAAIRAYGNSIWNGHVSAWLADWNLNESEAAAKIGTQIHGMTCMAVQWASPSSNPNTLVPGTNVTLKAANCDLSVCDATWIPSGGWGTPKPATPPPAHAPMPGILVYGAALQSRKVTSTDGGVTWR